MGEKWKSHTLPQFCQGHWMHCCQHWYTGFGGGKGMICVPALEVLPSYLWCGLIFLGKLSDDVHWTICPMILQCIVQCLFNSGVPNLLWLLLCTYLSIICTYLSIICTYWCSQILFLFKQFIEKPDWLTQTYILLDAASFSSWIDITNHKGKSWTELCIFGRFSFQTVVELVLHRINIPCFIRSNFWLIWTSRRHRSWWSYLMIAK